MMQNSFLIFLIVSDRDHFIIYYLTKGLKEHLVELGEDFKLDHYYDKKFEHLIEPPNFSNDLLEWTKDDFEMQDDDVVHLVQRSSVCINGKCFNVSDVGSNCCIFG